MVKPPECLYNEQPSSKYPLINMEGDVESKEAPVGG